MTLPIIEIHDFSMACPCCGANILQWNCRNGKVLVEADINLHGGEFFDALEDIATASSEMAYVECTSCGAMLLDVFLAVASEAHEDREFNYSGFEEAESERLLLFEDIAAELQWIAQQQFNVDDLLPLFGGPSAKYSQIHLHRLGLFPSTVLGRKHAQLMLEAVLPNALSFMKESMQPP
jgi:hypothetical protein